MPTLPLRIDRAASDPLPAQVAGQVRALVVAGTLTRGDRLPSSPAGPTSQSVAAQLRPEPPGDR